MRPTARSNQRALTVQTRTQLRRTQTRSITQSAKHTRHRYTWVETVNCKRRRTSSNRYIIIKQRLYQHRPDMRTSDRQTHRHATAPISNALRPPALSQNTQTHTHTHTIHTQYKSINTDFNVIYCGRCEECYQGFQVHHCREMLRRVQVVSALQQAQQ